MLSISLDEISKGLNSISWDILNMLSKNEDLTYSEIKKRLNVSQDKASKEIARLEGGILIESNRDAIDKRVVKFKLTKHGEDLIYNK